MAVGWRRLTLDDQRGALFAWIPVWLGVGIGLYFALPVEPGPVAWIALAAILAAGSVLLLLGLWRYPPLVALILVGTGFGLGGLRAWQVAEPVLHFRYYGAVEGRIVEVDQSASERPRLTLDEVVLERMDPDVTPARVRLSLHSEIEVIDPAPGQRILVTANLSPPEGPVEPGGFDFQRMAYFDRLGAVGYARSPAVLLEASGYALPVDRMRSVIGGYIRHHLPGEIGAFAAAITTGDRSGIPEATLQDLRVSNLAHLLAISGLHMGVLTAVVFGFLRAALALFPGPALRWPTKSIAALGALAAAAFYLALSGGNVATQRAFIMAAVILLAVIVGRRAMTLRSVALAALVVLALRPEALTGPGFQMSFAATTALVAVFRLLRDRLPGHGGGPMAFVATLILSSAVAGFATAPYSAAHFNQISQYGLLANMVTVPLMGAILMPAAVVAAVLAPFGLAWLALWLMAPAIWWILAVAHRIAGLDGSAIPIPAPAAAVLPMLTFGALWLILWRGRRALLGLAPVAVSLALWVQSTRPEVLIDGGGGLIGILGGEGRALSKPRGSGFAAGVWLENDGDPVSQEAAAARPGLTRTAGAAVGRLGDLEIWHVYGRGAAERALAACSAGRIIVTTADLPDTDACLMLDEPALRATGAIALRRSTDGIVIETARNASGERPWTTGPSRTSEAPPDPQEMLIAALADQ